MEFRDWMNSIHVPLILTSTSSEAERLCWKNGLSLSNLLNAFTCLENLNVPIRNPVSSSQPMHLTKFRFRFVDAVEFDDNLNDGENQELLSQRFGAAVNDIMDRHGGHHQPTDLPAVYQAEDVPVFLEALGFDPLPWYSKIKDELISTLRHEDATGSMLNCPAAMVFIVSSKEANPIQKLHDLKQLSNLPQAFQNGYYNAEKIKQYHIILHDEVEARTFDPRMLARQFHTSFGQGTFQIVRLNSLPIDSLNANQYDLWTSCPHVNLTRDRHTAIEERYPRAHPTTFGCCLTSEDIGQLRSFVWDFGVYLVLPALEARLIQLNETVSSVKKGVKNVLKSWWRKPKESINTAVNNSNTTISGSNSITSGSGSSSSRNYNTVSNIVYRHDSIEAQTRFLADTGFLLGDYEFALSTYRLVREDYKTDKNMMHYAGVNEMIAICYALTSGASHSSPMSPMSTLASAPASLLMDASGYMMNSLVNVIDVTIRAYIEVIQKQDQQREPHLRSIVPQLLAIRCIMFASEIYRSFQQMDLATSIIVSGTTQLHVTSTSFDICKALLMERAALCDLQQSQHPKFRKFAFRMTLAGNYYLSLVPQQPHDASRCYHYARAVHEYSGWQSIENFLDYNFAQYAFQCQHDRDQAIELYLKLISNGHFQKQVFAEFDNILTLQESTNPLLVPEFGIPVIQDKTLRVCRHYNAFRTQPRIYSLQVEKEWQKIKDGMTEEEEFQMEKDRQKQIENNTFSWTESVQQVLHEQHKNGSRNHRRRKSKAMLAEHQAHFCVIGETLFFRFCIKNPLTQATTIESLHLYGEFIPSEANDSTESSSKTVVEIPSDKVGHFDNYLEIERLDLNFEPNEERVVQLSITARESGEFHIIGCRWFTLFQHRVMSEHVFHIAGPLLQKKREQRALRLRAPNDILKGTIGRTMPWLGIRLHNPIHDHAEKSNMVGKQENEDDEVVLSMFRDETKWIELELENRGNATLTGLLIKSTLPCIAFGDEVNVEAIGMNGTCFYVHRKLKAGASVVLPVCIRGMTSKHEDEQDFTNLRLVFRYGKDHGDGEDDEKRIHKGDDVDDDQVRYVHFTIKIALRSSLGLNSVCKPSFSHSRDYIFGMMIENYIRTSGSPKKNPQHQPRYIIQLDRVLFLSQHYRIEAFPSLENSSGSNATKNYDIEWKEQNSQYFRVYPSTSTEDKTSRQNYPHCTNLPLSSPSAALPRSSLQLLLFERAFEELSECKKKYFKHLRQQNLEQGGGMRSIQSVRRDRAEDSTAATPSSVNSAVTVTTHDPLRPFLTPLSMEKLWHSTDRVNAIVCWSIHEHTPSKEPNNHNNASRVVATGQSHFPSILMKQPKTTNQCPLTLVVHFQPQIKLRSNELLGKGVYYVELPVDITVRNNTTLRTSDEGSTTLSEEVSYTFEIFCPEDHEEELDTRHTSASPPSKAGVQAKPSRIAWIGCTRSSQQMLQSGESKTFSVTASFTSPGIYDLNRFHFSIHAESKKSPSSTAKEQTKFIFPVQYLVEVLPPNGP